MKSMMRYYMHDGPAAFRFELAGVLASDDARRLEQDWRTASSVIGDRVLLIDMSFVTGIDDAVKSLFRRWYDEGAQFAANSARSRELVEMITGRPFLNGPPAAPTYRPWHSLRAILFVVLMFVLSTPVRAAVDNGASLAFARFVSRSGQIAETGVTDVEITASLKQMGKQGQLEAIRRRGLAGVPAYEVVRSQGDSTVKHQVIARYLAIEEQASSRPASLLAITTENYRFRYAASIAGPGYRFYVFEIKPRHRRDGLLDGQIWIDGDTGAVVHQEGHLQKPRSVFIRSIELVRDAGPRVDSPYSRVTRIEIETRMFGPAELTIRERPAAEVSNSEAWQ